MDIRPAQELVVLLRRNHFMLSLAVCKSLEKYTDTPQIAIVQLGISLSQYTEYTQMWGQNITVHINMLYSVSQSTNGQSHDNHLGVGMHL